MGLIRCGDCGKHVSSRAGRCPSCGAPIKQAGSILRTGCGCLLLCSCGVVALFVLAANQAANVRDRLPPENQKVSPVANATPIYPYELINTKVEDGKDSNVMHLYAYSGDFDIQQLRKFCRERKTKANTGSFNYVVIFDKKENAKFPKDPFTAVFGDEKNKLRHIRAIYEYNRVNGFSELKYYDTNAWNGKATREKI